MILIDEKFLERILRKEDDLWKRPTDQTVKSQLNRELKSDLDYSNIPDDIKVKQHQQHLNRFLQTKRQLQEDSVKNLIDFEASEPAAKNLIDFEAPDVAKKSIDKIEPAVGDLLGSFTQPIKSKKIGKKKASVSIRHSKREPKKKIVWQEWTK